MKSSVMAPDEAMDATEAPYEDEEEQGAQGFDTIAERDFETKVDYVCWSPSIDIFVVILQGKKNVDLYHMDLRKLWSTSFSTRISALTWSSDGKSVVLGFENGEVALVDAESSKTIDTNVKHTSGVSVLFWHDVKDSSTFPLLFSCDMHLQIQVSVKGLLPICNINVDHQKSLHDSIGVVRPVDMVVSEEKASLFLLYSKSQGNNKFNLEILDIDITSFNPADTNLKRWADYELELEKHMSQVRASLKSFTPIVAYLNHNYPRIEEPADSSDFSSSYNFDSQKLHKALLMGYSSVADVSVGQKTCKVQASEVDKFLKKIHQTLVDDLLPTLEKVHACLDKNLCMLSTMKAGSQHDMQTKNLQQMLKYVIQSLSMVQSLLPGISMCSQNAREYFTWFHCSQLAFDKEQVPHSQVKALLTGHDICENMSKKGSDYLCWESFSKVFEDFKEVLFSILDCHSENVQLPSKVFSDKTTVSVPRLLDEGESSYLSVCTIDSRDSNVYLDIMKVPDHEEGEAEYWIVIFKKGSHLAKVLAVKNCILRETKYIEFPNTISTLHDFRFYKWPWLAWIVQREGEDRTAISLINIEDLSTRNRVLVTDDLVREEHLESDQVGTFGVSTNRGTAFVQEINQNVHVFDLESA